MPVMPARPSEAELKFARDAVARSRVYRDQMREDWAYHREPEEILDDALAVIVAERDRLRTALEAMADEVSNEAFHPNALLNGDGSPILHSAFVLQLIAQALDGGEAANA
jgi:hypothetical protein